MRDSAAFAGTGNYHDDAALDVFPVEIRHRIVCMVQEMGGSRTQSKIEECETYNADSHCEYPAETISKAVEQKAAD